MKTPHRIQLDLNGAFATQLTPTDHERLWERIDTALDETAGNAADHRQPPLRQFLSQQGLRMYPRGILVAVVVALCAGLALFSLSSWAPSSRSQRSAALALSDGSVFTGARTDSLTQAFAFTDGSQISLGKNSQIDVLAMTGDQVLLRLIHGAADFQVEKGGPRRWRIEAGIAAVEVVGTRFSVERATKHVRVVVKEGRVLVRSSQLIDGVTRLDAGETISVTSDSPTQIEANKKKEEHAIAPIELSELTEAPNDAPPQAAAETIEDLLHKADQARLAGDLAGALIALEAIVRRFPADARAPLSSFQLGRIHQKQNDMSQAERAYKWTIEHSSSDVLREDCYVRLVETQLTRDTQAARRTAHLYLNEFPAGRHVGSIQAMLKRTPAPPDPDAVRVPN